MTSYLKRNDEEIPVREGWMEWLCHVASTYMKPEDKDVFRSFSFGDVTDEQAFALHRAIRDALDRRAGLFIGSYSRIPERTSHEKALQIAEFCAKGAFKVDIA